MEVVDIDLDSIPISSEPSGSSNFGTGIELLMNEKMKASTGSTKIDLEELDNLESELNNLSQPGSGPSISLGASEGQSGGGATGETKQLSGLSGFSNMFNFGDNHSKSEKPSGPAPEPASSSFTFFESDSNVGSATKDHGGNLGGGGGASTWDGFSKMGAEIPKSSSTSAPMTERERRRKKRLMIKKLEEWQSKGTYTSSSHFDMDSNYEEVEDEYEGALEEKRKKDSIKLQGWWFTTVINTVEYGNALLNPFDLNLDGWGEQVSEDLDSYEEIFAELHDKYKGGKMAPEVSLLLRVGFSAAVVNMSNKMLSTATPGFNDVIKQSPELMKMFTSAAVDTMSQQNSAFDFAKTMMSPDEQVNTKFGPPPAPVETKTQAPPQRPGQMGQMQFTQAPGNRPDLSASRNTPMFREQGVDLTSQYNVNQTDSIIPPAAAPKRPEMRGPQTTDIDQLLSGLKTKSPEPPQNITMSQEIPVVETVGVSATSANESVISLSSLKDLDNTEMPKRVKKRQNRSDKNTVSLDI